MAQKNRKTLKAYFQTGRLPSGEEFGDLIDSMLNVIDEGFDKTAEDGLKVAQLGDSGKMISFFENIDVRSPLWSIKLEKVASSDASSSHLIFQGKDNQDVLSLSPLGRVGINKKAPAYELDIEGFVASRGRIGGQSGYIHADGAWHDIPWDVNTVQLEGCHAFEVIAGVGKANSGSYALLHAFALNTFAAKGLFRRHHKIAHHQAYYGSRCNRLKLRWQRCSKHAHTYTLQLRTMCSYGDDVYIKYYITDLWRDTHMSDNKPNP